MADSNLWLLNESEEVMKLARLAILALVFISSNYASAAQNYSDWWWNSSQSGMGVHVNHQGSIVAATWFMYDSDGSPSFMLMAGTLSNNQLTASLWRSTGPQPGPNFDPNAVVRTVVGTATLTFTGSNSATLAYNYNDLSGTLYLSRNTFVTPSISGTVQYAIASMLSGCTNPGNPNGPVAYFGLASVALGNGQFSMTTVAQPGEPSCTYSTSFTQTGSTANGSGTFSCTDGSSGSMTFDDARVSDDGVVASYERQFTVGDTCKDVGKLVAVKR